MATDPLDKALRYRWFIFWILALGYVLVFGSPLLSYLSNKVFRGRKPVLIAGTAVGLTNLFPFVGG